MSQTQPKTNPTFTGEITPWPVWGETEEREILEVFRSGNWWFGDKIREFEEKYAAYQNAKHAITCSNGTIAIEIALKAMGIGPGDEVIVPDYTFIATAGAVANIGAIPRFADVDPISANIDLDSAEKLINPHTRALIVVHFAGLPVDMDKARAFAKKHNIRLMEDAAHGWGSQWDGQGVGAISEVGTFSFQVSKNLSAGEGGIIVTNDDELARMCRSYSNCGRLEGFEWYEHFHLGGNNRMTEFQAAILLGQLERSPEHVERREENVQFLNTELSKIPGLRVPGRDPKVTRRSHHLYILNFTAAEFGNIERKDFLIALENEGVPCSGGYLVPVHANYCFLNLNDNARPENRWLSDICNERGIRFSEIHNPNATRLTEETMVWFYHTLLLGSRQDMEQVVEAVHKIHRQANS